MSPRTRVLLTYPPPSLTWIPSDAANELEQAVLELAGPTQLRALAREAARDGIGTLLRPALERIFRAAGVSPATVFSQGEALVRLIADGIRVEYTAEGPRSGVVRLVFVKPPAPTEGQLIASCGSLELVVELCSERGVVGDPQIDTREGEAPSARYPIRW